MVGVYLIGMFIYENVGHHGHEDSTTYPYMKTRRKPFPWKLKDCDLFDLDCKARARAIAAGQTPPAAKHH